MEALSYQRSVIKSGWIEGRAEGREEGRAEGMKEKALDTARRMKQLGLPTETIAQCTQLSMEEIEKLEI